MTHTTHYDGFPRAKIIALATHQAVYERALLMTPSEFLGYHENRLKNEIDRYGVLHPETDSVLFGEEIAVREKIRDFLAKVSRHNLITFSFHSPDTEWEDLLTRIAKAVFGHPINYILCDGYLRTNEGVAYLLGYEGTDLDREKIVEIMRNATT